MTDKEKHREEQRKYRENHREEYNAYHREYYARFKAEGLPNPKAEANARWKEKNLEKVREYRRGVLRKTRRTA